MSTIESETQKPEKKPKLFWLEKFGMRTHNRRFWSTDKFFSLFAFLISVGTFATFAYQTYLIRKQQYASVMPYLMINHNYTSKNDYRVELVNNGVGPAFIEEIKVHYEEQTYNYGPHRFVINVIYPHNPINIGGWEPVVGFAMPAGQTIPLVLSNNEKAADILQILFQGNTAKAKIEITYSSIYDETWVIKPPSLVPEKLE